MVICLKGCERMLRNSNTEKQERKLTSVQLIVLFYISAVLFSALLLILPFIHKNGMNLTFIDALFTAVSAISVTGLTVVSTADTFNTAGYFILAFILQFGGIGIMTLGTFLWLLFGKQIGLKDRQLIMIDQNRSTFSGLVLLMKRILVLIISIEIIGGIILGLHFLNYFPTWEEAFVQGFFASVSATTNAGFDITGESLVPFAHDYFVQTVNMILLILGAVGFPVLLEVMDFIKNRKNESYRFTLFTKLTTVTFFSLVILGALLIFLLELNHFFKDKMWHETLFYSLFQSVTTRNGGLATMDVSEFTAPTLLILSGLMFVGASPSSVGGGIRTTTFAIMILSIIFYAKGRNSIKVFGREVDPVDVQRSFIVITTASLLCGSSIVLLTILEPSMSLLSIVFEVTSAFGTTGLSMGITADLSTAGKIVIIALMFIGRIGIFSFLFIIRGNVVSENFKYPKENVIIG
jgi:Trk-type K+ transport system membrane component